MDYFRSDFHRFVANLNSQLSNIAASNQDIVVSNSNIASTMDRVNTNIQQLGSISQEGFDQLTEELWGLSTQLEEITDFVKDVSAQQFIQNEHRNHLLASIDETLKSPNKTAANEKYEFGIEMARRGRPDYGIKLLEESIELNPLHYRSYIQLALFHIQMQQYQEVLKFASESIFHAPSEYGEFLGYSHYLVARAHDKLGNVEKAMESINQAVSYDSTPEYLYEQARYSTKANNFADAIDPLTRAIEGEQHYFGQSLIETAFHLYRPELEKLLHNIKDQEANELNRKLRNSTSHTFFDYDLSQKEHCQFFTYGNDIMTVLGLDGEQIPYGYNSFIEKFENYYSGLKLDRKNLFNRINQLSKDNSYISIRQANDEMMQFKQYYDSRSEALHYFVAQIKEAGKRVRKELENKIKYHEERMNEYAAYNRSNRFNRLFGDSRAKEKFNDNKIHLDWAQKDLQMWKEETIKFEVDKSDLERFCNVILHEQPIKYVGY